MERRRYLHEWYLVKVARHHVFELGLERGLVVMEDVGGVARAEELQQPKVEFLKGEANAFGDGIVDRDREAVGHGEGPRIREAVRRGGRVGRVSCVQQATVGSRRVRRTQQ